MTRRSACCLLGILVVAGCDSLPLELGSGQGPEVRVPVEGETYRGRVPVQLLLRDGGVDVEISYSLDGGPRVIVPAGAFALSQTFDGYHNAAAFELSATAGPHRLRLYADGAFDEDLSQVHFTVDPLPFRYEVEELDLPGDSISIAGLHDDGTVLFSSVGGSGRSSYLLAPSGTITPIGDVIALDMNDAKQVVGITTWAYGVGLPFVWSDGDLQTLSNDFKGLGARAIADNGTVLLGAGESFGIYRDGEYTYYGRGYGKDVNDAGEVLFVTTMDPQSAKITNGSREVLLGGSKVTRVGSINNRGNAVFSSKGRGQSPYWGSIAGVSGIHRGLGTLYPEPTPTERWYYLPLEATLPVDLNDRDEVVGSASRVVLDSRGFLWIDGEIIDLTALVPEPWVVDDAVKINNEGDIVGRAHEGSGESRIVYLRVAI